jgi:hypothetical protein
MQEWSASRPGRFTPGEIAPDTHWIGRWVGPRACLDAMEERKILPLPGIEPQPSSALARRYTDSATLQTYNKPIYVTIHTDQLSYLMALIQVNMLHSII